MNKIKGYLEKKENEIIGIASTEAVDRDGEVILQKGWDLENFKRNPVLLVGHNYQEFPIGKATDIRIEDGKLVFNAIFSKATEKAKEAYELVREGILNSFSVGFIPRDWDSKDSKIITKAELLEISLVPVPANPEAIVLAKEYKKNEIAKYLVKNFFNEDKAEATEGEETIKEKTSEDVKNIKDGKVGNSSNEIDLKLLQATVGHLQILCRDLKKKGGGKK